MQCGLESGALTRAVLVLGLVIFAGGLLAQSPPYGGYSPSPYSSGTSFSPPDYIDDVTISRGSTTLLSNMNTGPGASPYNTYYGGTVPAANLIPGQVHTVTVGNGPNWTLYFTVWIDYDNNGVFNDTNERVCYSQQIATGGTGSATFTPPSGVGGIRRLRIRSSDFTPGPHTAYGSISYGEAEDYLVNLGFAISTAAIPNAAEGFPYSATIQATNGTLPYTWNTTISGLPNGVTAAQVNNDLVLSGQPTTNPPTAGSYPITVTVQDDSSPPSIATKPFTLYVAPPPASMPFSDDFSGGQGFWQLSTGWTVGSATAFSGNTSTGPSRTEPGQDTSSTQDNNILGHMIGADYTNNMPVAYAISPPINCFSAAVVHVRFQRWLGVAVGDWGEFQVTNDGVNWTTLFTNNGTSSVNTPNAWEPYAYDATAVAAGNAVVQFRFVLGPTNADIVNVGWCIDDFEVLDPGPPLLVEEGGVGGTPITDDEAVGGLRNWGQVNTGTNSSILTVAFTNNGISPIIFGSFFKTGNDPLEFYVIKQITVNPLPVGQTDTMEFRFNSPTAGVHTCTINVPHNIAAGAGTSPFEINLEAEAVTPVPDMRVYETSASGNPIAHQQSPTGTIRDFGSQDIALGPTAAITVTIVNSGTGSMSLLSPYMSGTWHNQFTLTIPASFPSVLASGASASFEVAFDPTSAGPKDAWVGISHSDNSKPVPYEIPVFGVGTTTGVPIFTASDSAGAFNHNDMPADDRDFGNVLINTTAGPITITITNNGGVDLTVGQPVLAGPNAAEFSVNTTSGPYTSPVASGTSTSFEVSFTPTSIGQKDATISITHDDNTITTPFVINLTGVGVTASPTATVHAGGAGGQALTSGAPATGVLDFGVQDTTAGPTAPVTIHVENTGTSPLTVAAPTLTGANASEFQLQNTGTFAQTLAVGASATFDIVYDPANVGNHVASVRFTHNDTATGSPFIINVVGLAVLNAPIVQVRVGSLTGPTVSSGAPATVGGPRDLGNVNVTAGASAPLVIVLVNQGTLDLNLGNPTLTGPDSSSFVLIPGSFNQVVTPGSNTSFQVTFDPNLGGYKDARIEFTHDDPTSPDPFLVHIRGTAVDPTGVQITTTSVPAGAAGEAYTPTQMQAIQGTTPYVWSVYSGNLPAGLNLSTGGLIDGTPTGFGGTFRVTLRVTDANGATFEREFVFAVSSNLSASGRASSGGCAAGESSTGLIWMIALLAAMVGSARLFRRRNA